MKKNLATKIYYPQTVDSCGSATCLLSTSKYDDLCIKVHFNGRSDKETLREIRYYKRLYKKSLSTNTISHYYGTQETNFGLGYVFQLIKDKTGNVSHTLRIT
ncbi:YrbL family protein [Providencia hangzhouensis]